MKDEALKLALKALELSSVTVDSFGVQRKTQEAITAIKQALAAPVQEPFAWVVDSENSADWAIAKTKEGVEINAKLLDADCIKTEPFPLYTTPPAQPAPTCTRSHPHENMDALCELRTEIARLTNENARLKAQPAPVQEPVVFKQFLSDVHTAAGLVMYGKQCKALGERLSEGVMRYYITTPPAAQRQWVGLTEDEIEECASYGYRYDVVAVTEDKLKEKNSD